MIFDVLGIAIAGVVASLATRWWMNRKTVHGYFNIEPDELEPEYCSRVHFIIPGDRINNTTTRIVLTKDADMVRESNKSFNEQ